MTAQTLPDSAPLETRIDFTPGVFRAPWWLPEGHSQTIYAGRMRPVAQVPVVTEAWTMPDGERIRIDTAGPAARLPTTPTVIVLHGLESDCDARYVRGILARVHRRGWLGVAKSFRGCSGMPYTTPRSYHAGFTEDLEEVVRELTLRRPASPIFIVGFSLGGNVVLKLLGLWSSGAPANVVGAATVSSPYSLQQCSASLDRRTPMITMYRELFLMSIRAKTAAYQKRWPGRIDDIDPRTLTSFRRFDEVLSTRITGSATVEEYWTQHSARSFLPRITVPTLLVNAEDDPMVPGQTIPVDEIRRVPSLHLSLHRSGGHLGFVHGSPNAPQFFAEEEVMRFFEAVARSIGR